MGWSPPPKKVKNFMKVANHTPLSPHPPIHTPDPHPTPTHTIPLKNKVTVKNKNSLSQLKVHLTEFSKYITMEQKRSIQFELIFS